MNIHVSTKEKWALNYTPGKDGRYIRSETIPLYTPNCLWQTSLMDDRSDMLQSSTLTLSLLVNQNWDLKWSLFRFPDTEPLEKNCWCLEELPIHPVSELLHMSLSIPSHSDTMTLSPICNGCWGSYPRIMWASGWVPKWPECPRVNKWPERKSAWIWRFHLWRGTEPNRSLWHGQYNI